MAEEVTYADLKFMTLKQTKKQEEKQGAGGKASPPVSHHWRLATVTLGIFCLALLGASGALGFKGHRCSPCPERWLQRGENCYYFSTKWNSWEESKAQCATLNSRLLKIESKEELV
ncbi:PREDICTED: C-type lectin domain family 12 member A-like isoform X2 [Gekko japonicus]|uniref:C-type lectin domain family 12 member A-like isoform X2 n=1 Tax=Gekko japonicus TaxID=146911 RepID=A0ABM1JWJ2_GEKJA|nr:PREDICTED: C-type lectin domain family 12 member A-like isoform X2 [Gekko japonicus]